MGLVSPRLRLDSNEINMSRTATTLLSALSEAYGDETRVLTVDQVRILMYLASKDFDATVSELADSLKIRLSVMSKVLRILGPGWKEKSGAGLISIRRSGTDQRVKLVTFTDKGLALLKDWVSRAEDTRKGERVPDMGRCVLVALTELQALIGKDARYLTLDQVRVLLAIAGEGSTRQRDIEKLLTLSQSTVNRVADRLGRSGRRGEGLELIERIDDAADARYRILHLSTAGNILAGRWAEQAVAAFALLPTTA